MDKYRTIDLDMMIVHKEAVTFIAKFVNLHKYLRKLQAGKPNQII